MARRNVIEFFDVPDGEDEAFLSAFGDRGALFRALRDDARPRYMSLTDPPAGGVVLVAATKEFDETKYAGRQGFLGARAEGDLVLVHWSSPLMYQRAGEPVPGGVLYSKSPVR
jgi:hypothetical protein